MRLLAGGLGALEKAIGIGVISVIETTFSLFICKAFMEGLK